MEHSVTIDGRRCRGCTTCIKICPTESIRVRDGQAAILSERCIDCGSCIRVCPHRAIYSAADPLSAMDRFSVRVAVPDPVLYGQFGQLSDVGQILTGLERLGFQRVFEPARSAELLADQTARQKKSGPFPRISSGCPAVLRLIRLRFPHLIDHVEPVMLSMEFAAIQARRVMAEETGLPPEEIGVFAIVPCAAKVTAARKPEGLERPVLDGAFSIQELCLELVRIMPPQGGTDRSTAAGRGGISTAFSGGEGALRGERCALAVDGIRNVIEMLEEVEDGRQSGVEFLELWACTQGCVGGRLNVENPYVARMHLSALAAELPQRGKGEVGKDQAWDDVTFTRTLQYSPAFQLDEDRAAAMEKYRRIDALAEQLPGLHCGACGAPNCRAFAEDVVQGRAEETDCIFFTQEENQPTGLPPSFLRREEG